MSRTPCKQRADLSVEIAHVYTRCEKPVFESAARAAARAAERWVMPAVYKWRDAEHRKVSLVVMLDDYEPQSQVEPLDHDYAADTIQQYLEEAGIAPDFICWESKVAETAETLLPLIEPAPSKGAGSWASLTNFNEEEGLALFDYRGRGPFQTGSDWAAASDGPSIRNPAEGIGLSVELYERSRGKWIGWSCPAAAAWWQMIRLGALSAGAPPGGDGGDASRNRTRRCREEAVFAAKRTLTLLPPSYLPVEHAVTRILQTVRLPDDIRAELGFTEEMEDGGELLRRVSYVFADPDF